MYSRHEQRTTIVSDAKSNVDRFDVAPYTFVSPRFRRRPRTLDLHTYGRVRLII